jgi:pimeloyl-ACP methyl ester carboxylesterase/DNA-binding CsgD family transcriptional regulator
VSTEPVIRHAKSTDGTSIAWSTVGSGPALVHLPGVPFSNLQAEWQIPLLRNAFHDLARHLQFIQFDGRGTGHSQRAVSDLSFEALLGDIDGVVDAAGLKRFALLGFYHSVTHAIAYAARHPDRVTSLILFGGSARGWNPMSGAATQALLSLIERDWDTFVESITHAWLGWPNDDEGRLAAEWFRTSTTPSIARETMEIAATVDVSGDLPKVRCPVLVLHRRGSTVIPLHLAEELASGLPRAELRIIEGRSESLFFERTNEVVDLIIEFMTGRPMSRPAAAGAPHIDLTARERAVLRLIAAGETNDEIARRLGITDNTVERHVTNIYRKIDARGRADATAFAIRHRLA